MQMYWMNLGSTQNVPKNVEWRMLEFTYAPHHTIPSSYKNTFAHKYYVDKLAQMILIFIVAEKVNSLSGTHRMKCHLFKWNMERFCIEYAVYHQISEMKLLKIKISVDLMRSFESHFLWIPFSFRFGNYFCGFATIV